MKATYVEIIPGSANCQKYSGNNVCADYLEDECTDSGNLCQIPKGREIFKDPVTDDGNKKSAKGLLHVTKMETKVEGIYDLNLIDQVSWEREKGGLLQTIFKDGKFYNKTTLTKIRQLLTNIV